MLEYEKPILIIARNFDFVEKLNIKNYITGNEYAMLYDSHEFVYDLFS